jgi:hypothetical protein
VDAAKRIGSGLDGRFAEGPVPDPPQNSGRQVAQRHCTSVERGAQRGSVRIRQSGLSGDDA